MPVMRYREALNQALREEMEADESVFIMGEDVGVFQGAFKVTAGLLEEFGEKRVRDTPISENTIVGHGRGRRDGRAAAGGGDHDRQLRAARDGPDREPRGRDPLHVRRPGARCRWWCACRRAPATSSGPPTHTTSRRSSSTCPACSWPCRPRAADAKGLLKAAIRDDNPVVFIEHETLYGQRGEVPENGGPMRFGEAAVRREGEDVTVVGISRMAITALKAAETLAEEHEIDAEVIDPRTLRPLDLDTILDSVKKTNRAVIVEEGWPHGGVGANLAALIQEQAFDWLDAPVQRVTGADVPMPYSKPLEQAAFPHEEHVVHAALATFRDV